jgi:hypothetical protein
MSIPGLNSFWLNYEFNLIEKYLNRDSWNSSDPMDALNSPQNLNLPAPTLPLISPTTVLNVNKANSLLLTANSGLNVQISLATEMKKMADLARDPTITGTHRSDLNNAFQDLYHQFQSITANTQYQGIKLLNGTFSARDLPLGSEVNPSGVLSVPGLENSNYFLQGLNLTLPDLSSDYKTGNGAQSFITADTRGMESNYLMGHFQLVICL